MIQTSLSRLVNADQRKTLNPQQDRERYSWEHYSGEFVYPDNVTLYLHKQWQRESQNMYAERCLWADPAMHFATVVDELTGMVMANNSEISRQWSEEGTINALGDPDDGNSVSYRLMKDCDGLGTNWDTFWNKASVNMTVLRKPWIFVDGVTMDGSTKTGEAKVHIIKPWNILDYVTDSEGHIIEVKMRLVEDTRTSVKDSVKPEQRYIIFGLEGWSMYDAQDNVIRSDEYAYFKDSSRQQRILPIFPFSLSLEREVGYLLARKCNTIFNTESVRDFAVRNITFNFLRLVGNDDEFNAKVNQLREGTNVLQQNPSYSQGDDFIALDVGMVDATSKVLLEKIGVFYAMAFKEYNDAAAVKTATEIVQKSASSLNAFLTLLSTALDEAENAVLWRLTQIYNPENPAVWPDSYVARSTDFVPADVEGTINNLVRRYIGADKVIPLPDDRLKDVLTTIANLDNYKMQGEDLDEVVARLRAEPPAM
jgi:hypothetical protein